MLDMLTVYGKLDDMLVVGNFTAARAYVESIKHQIPASTAHRMRLKIQAALEG